MRIGLKTPPLGKRPTYVEALRVLLAVRLGDALVLHCLEYLGHGGNEGKGHAGMLVGSQGHHLVSPLLVGHHGQGGLRIFVVDGIVDGAHVQHIVEQLAAHGHQDGDGMRFVFHGGQVESGVLEEILI